MSEIERKFLVTDPNIVLGEPGIRIDQGYLSTDPERCVRVRYTGADGYLTIKAGTGLVRDEFEYAIPSADAVALLSLCAGRIIEKTRYHILADGRLWEVDVYHADLAGLVTAEVELDAPDERVTLPPWVGEEVTEDERFSNLSLSLAHSIPG